jgi:hypothetical protein
LSDAVEAVLVTALRLAEWVLRKADVGGPDALHSHSKQTTVADVDVRVDVTVRGPECHWDVPNMNPPEGVGRPVADARPSALGAAPGVRPGFTRGGAAVAAVRPGVRASR